MTKIKVGIVGYGNLGKGVEKAISKVSDMKLVGIFSRRDPKTLDTQSPSYHMDELLDFKRKIDVLVLAGGSRKDIPEQGPDLAKNFNTVDAFDTHADIDSYFNKMNRINSENKTTSIISTGWDPGLFSLLRAIGIGVLPDGKTYTFWGKGLSQGHSDAVRQVEGVKLAAQYTIPKESMLEDLSQGKEISYTSQSAHDREVYLVAEEKADKKKIKESIITMPDYFEGYNTTVNFISEEEYYQNHTGMPHGGRIVRQGSTSKENQALISFDLDLGSNPEFTASVSLAYGRACARLAREGKFSSHTVLDVPISYIMDMTDEEIRKTLI